MLKTRASNYSVISVEMTPHEAGFSNYGAEIDLSNQTDFPEGFIDAICMGVFYKTSGSRLGIGYVHETKISINTCMPGEYSIRVLYLYK